MHTSHNAKKGNTTIAVSGSPKHGGEQQLLMHCHIEVPKAGR